MQNLLLLLGFLLVGRSSGLTLLDCGVEARLPQFTDIAVQCGTSSISLAIQICPVIYSGYNETLLILNYMTDPLCQATLDASASPPVARFTFPLNATNACGSIFRTTTDIGTGLFSDFSNIQTINVSGVVRTTDPTIGAITYKTELKYFYSCAYPLEYLVNNTQVDVSSSSIAVKDNNGSFISTLKMELYSDANFTQPMVIPKLGILLRTNIYVQVKATNLTGQYNVLLDRCYATISALPSNSSFFNLFFSCNKDQFTNITLNGDSQIARFNFPAFRFLEQQNQTVSTYYLHCITRLCDVNTCSTFKLCNTGRRRRSPEDSVSSTQTYTITSQEIKTRADTTSLSKEQPATAGAADPSIGLRVAVGFLAVGCIAGLGVAAVFYIKTKLFF